jgi:hypothetical protein
MSLSSEAATALPTVSRQRTSLMTIHALVRSKLVVSSLLVLASAACTVEEEGALDSGDASAVSQLLTGDPNDPSQGPTDGNDHDCGGGTIDGCGAACGVLDQCGLLSASGLDAQGCIDFCVNQANPYAVDWVQNASCEDITQALLNGGLPGDPNDPGDPTDPNDPAECQFVCDYAVQCGLVSYDQGDINQCLDLCSQIGIPFDPNDPNTAGNGLTCEDLANHLGYAPPQPPPPQPGDECQQACDFAQMVCSQNPNGGLDSQACVDFCIQSNDASIIYQLSCDDMAQLF